VVAVKEATEVADAELARWANQVGGAGINQDRVLAEIRALHMELGASICREGGIDSLEGIVELVTPRHADLRPPIAPIAVLTLLHGGSGRNSLAFHVAMLLLTLLPIVLLAHFLAIIVDFGIRDSGFLHRLVAS